ncbi:MAG: oligosaccharide flippase family protein [Pseudomonadota bacterium]
MDARAGPAGPPKKRRRARRAGLAAFAFISRSLQQISTFVITLMAAGFLSPAEYGVYALGVVFIVLIQTMTYTGFYHFVIHSPENEVAVLSTSFWMIVGLATAAAALLAAAAYPLGYVYDAPDLALVLILFALVQPLAGAGAWCSATLLRREKMMAHFGIMFAQNFVALIGGAVLLWLWQSLFALVAYRYLRVLTASVLYLIFTRDRPALQFDRSLAYRATGFSGGLYAARFLTFLSRYSADLLLGLFFSTAESGLYRFGSRVATGATDVVSQPLSSFAHTRFGAAGREQRDLSVLLAKFVGTSTILVGGVVAVIMIFAPAVVNAFFDPAYLAAIPVAYAMAVRALLFNGSRFVEPTFSARGQTWYVTRFDLWLTGATLVAVFATAPFGLLILAWGQVAVAVLGVIVAFVLIQRHAEVDIGPVLRAFIFSLVVVVGYGVVTLGTWEAISAWIDIGARSNAALGLAWAIGMSIPALFLAHRLRLVTLTIFSG